MAGDPEMALVGVLSERGRWSSRDFLVSNMLTRIHEGNGHCLSTESKRRKASYRENVFFFLTYGTISKVMESSCLFSIKGRKAKKLI